MPEYSTVVSRISASMRPLVLKRTIVAIFFQYSNLCFLRKMLDRLVIVCGKKLVLLQIFLSLFVLGRPINNSHETLPIFERVRHNKWTCLKNHSWELGHQINSAAAPAVLARENYTIVGRFSDNRASQIKQHAGFLYFIFGTRVHIAKDSSTSYASLNFA